ncbi:MAG: uracil-DNA glycosylase [Bacillota bacterium]|nr:uracil-DNA glycosylase [Bacillota bacterium]
MSSWTWPRLEETIIGCRLCPRLVAYREEVAQKKVRRFQDWEYWGKPLPGFGDPNARLWILGLAPAAHGGLRTGRMFTGDASGDFLFSALHEMGWASQPESRERGDGLTLTDVYISASARCAPPKNKPLPQELKNCRPYLHTEEGLLGRAKAVLCLGRIAFDSYRQLRKERGLSDPNMAFSHGAIQRLEDGIPYLALSYHPSQQNTQTGRLTREMFLSVLKDIKTILEEEGEDAGEGGKGLASHQG